MRALHPARFAIQVPAARFALPLLAGAVVLAAFGGGRLSATMPLTAGGALALGLLLALIGAALPAALLGRRPDRAREERTRVGGGPPGTAGVDLAADLDALPSMIGYWDCNLINRFANRAFSRWFDVHPSTLPGSHMVSLFDGNFRTEDLRAIQKALAGEIVTYEKNLDDAAGRAPSTVQFCLVPDRQDGRIRGFYLIGHDITAEREVRRRLLESEKLLQRAESLSRVGGFMLDFESGVLQWTPQTYRIHELGSDQCPTISLIGTFMPPAMRERFEAALRAAREEGIGYDLELSMVTAAQREIWIRMTAEVEFECGVPARIFGAVQDVTDRCKLEQRLRDALAAADRASRSKSEFLANMSHEIRTPLNAVIGLGYLLEQTPLTDEQRQFLAKIQFAGRALLGVINNVLDLSKIEADEMALEDEPFDLPDLIRDLSQMLLPQALEKGIELRVEPAPSLPRRVIGDAARVRQILVNLLNNAIKFTEVGEVTLAAFGVEHGAGRIRLRCEVSDTGIGIEPAVRERLFTPFTQADASTTRRFGGTGLGLSIARRFVELMGGEIGVDSAVGVGSRFWIEIPLRVAPELDGASANALRILVVDPRGDTPQGLGGMVRALGWVPLIVESPEQARSIAAQAQGMARPDAVIVDWPGGDADCLAAQEGLVAPGRDEAPPVIVVAESPQAYLDRSRFAHEPEGVLVRPVSSSALFNAINRAVSRRADGCDRVFESTNFDELHAQWLSGVRVLVVDDSDINREVAQRILSNQGALVTTRCDGFSALAFLREHHCAVDVVLMDVQMPVLDGNEATRRVRNELHLDVPIVALTAGALVGERQRALDAGMNDFVSKPFDPQTLIRKVRSLVELRRGEPLPMVFDDRTCAQRTGASIMKSIDSGIVQQIFGEDVALFQSLLGRLLREYADLATVAPVAADEGSLELIKGRVHKLKGSAGMIGASNLMRLAGAAERALQESRAPEAVQSALRRVASALAALQEEAQRYLDESRDGSALRTMSAPAEIAAPLRIDLQDIQELCELLETHNLAAVDKFDLMVPTLRAMLDDARFEGLRLAVEDLDFRHGAELLREVTAERYVSAA
jgi:signal transduction histidine kinase/DNA-binding response OmpR family regulator/HPt (histidine-containing phosphotransfer) domain-containing protein